MNRLSFLALLALLACLPFQWAAADAPEIAMVVALQGAATARRVGTPPRPLMLYSPLFAGDTVAVTGGGSLTLRFSTGQSRTLSAASLPSARRILPPQAVSNTPVARLQRAVFDAQRRVYSQASRMADTAVRGGEDPTPALDALRPRGRTLRAGLVFQWAAQQPGSVRVSLYDGDGKKVWSEKAVSGDHLVYPGSAPALKPSQEYQWIVSDETVRTIAQAQFETAPDDVEKAVAADRTALEQLSFATEEERRLALASLLSQRRLYADVVTELETKPPSSPLAHAVLFHAWNALGDPAMASVEKAALGANLPAVCRQWEGQP